MLYSMIIKSDFIVSILKLYNFFPDKYEHEKISDLLLDSFAIWFCIWSQ